MYFSANTSYKMKLYGLHGFLVRKFTLAKDKLTEQKRGRVQNLLKLLFSVNFIGSVLQAFVNLYVIYYIIKGVYTIGDFVFIFASVIALSEAMSAVLDIIPNSIHNKKMIKELLQVLGWQSIDRCGESVGNGPIVFQFRSVGFSYPNHSERRVLSDITVDIHEGEKIAIVGANGSGKSTFLKLLLGFYESSEGDILFCGKRLSEYSTQEFCELFGIVFQDYLIYPITIAENILFQKERTKEDEKLVWDALCFAGLEEKVRSMPHGIDSVLTREFDGEGVYLSGGECQRLSIARAYARRSRILVFDEPASALDAFAERDIVNRMYQLGEGKTVLCVSHRLAIAEEADTIWVFDKGRIVEKGSHQELMEMKGVYYAMRGGK